MPYFTKMVLIKKATEASVAFFISLRTIAYYI